MDPEGEAAFASSLTPSANAATSASAGNTTAAPERENEQTASAKPSFLRDDELFSAPEELVEAADDLPAPSALATLVSDAAKAPGPALKATRLAALPDALSASPTDAEALSALCTEANDVNPRVREELAIGLASADTASLPAECARMALPTARELSRDPIEDVRAAACSAHASLAACLPAEERREEIATRVESLANSRWDGARTSAAAIVSCAAPHMGPDEAAVALDLAARLTDDRSQSVRRAAVTAMVQAATAAGSQKTEEVALPMLEQLSEQKSLPVRKAVASSIGAVATAVGSAAVSSTYSLLSSMLARLLNDVSDFVKSSAMSSLASIADSAGACPFTDAVMQALIWTVLGAPSTGVLHAAATALPAVLAAFGRSNTSAAGTQSTSPTTASATATASDVTTACVVGNETSAQPFPSNSRGNAPTSEEGMAPDASCREEDGKTQAQAANDEPLDGSSKADGTGKLLEAIEELARAPEAEVRAALLRSLSARADQFISQHMTHEVSKTTASLLSDTDPNVCLAALEGQARALQLVDPEQRASLAEALLAHVDAYAGKTDDWRQRLAVADALTALSVHLPASACFQRLLPAASTLLFDPVASVRSAAASQIGALLYRACDGDEMSSSLQQSLEPIKKAATSSSYLVRQSFVDVCQSMLSVFGPNFVAREFSKQLPELAHDRVRNVRSHVANLMENAAAVKESSQGDVVDHIARKLVRDRDAETRRAAQAALSATASRYALSTY